MIKIPEELLKCSTKELISKLPNNTYKAKYYTIEECIINKRAVIDKKTYFSSPNHNTSLAYSTNDLKSYVKPLTIEKIKQIKLDNLKDSILSMPHDKLYNLYYKKAVEIFGKDYVDFSNYEMVIWFPSVTINNSVEQSLEMKDIYVKLFFSNGRMRNIQLTRTTCTERELRNHYIFSHLNHNQIGTFSSSLCMGNTAISNITYTMGNSIKGTFFSFTYFCHLLNEYLSWESLEGVPYRKIDSVISDEERFIDKNIPAYSQSELLKLVYDNIESFTFNYQINGDGYFIKLSPDSINDVKNILTNHCAPELLSTNYNVRSVEIRDNGEQVNYNNYNGLDSQVTFKGSIIKNIVIKDDALNIESNLPIEIHSQILHNIVYLIQIRYREFIINKKLAENE